MMAAKPLMLKDFLALDSSSESCEGFRCYPRLADAATVRHLIDVELRVGGRTRSKGALTRISAAIKHKLLPYSSSSAAGDGSNQEGSLSRSFSERIKGSFWKKRGKEEDLEVEEGIGDRRSFEFPSPVVSSCSSWSDSDSSGSDFLPSSIASSEKDTSPPPRSPCRNPVSKASNVADESVEKATGHREQKRELLECPSEEEKEQLSPVSVMDFPFEDDDDEATSSFHRGNPRLERTKLHNIRRFESLAELAPVDLEERFATCDDHVALSDDGDHEEGEEEESTEVMAWGLLGVLKSSSSLGKDESVEKLLVDFFIEGLSCTDHERSNAYSTPAGLLESARDWIDGAGCCCDLRDGNGGVCGEMEIREMERNGRWRCFEEDQRGLGSDLEGLVLDSLVEEFVSEILVSVN